jgi:hypothetical protein
MTSPDLDRIRFVTRHFNELKGLGLMGSGLLLVGLGVPYFAGNSLRESVLAFCVQISLTVSSVVLTFYAKTYYQKRFGEVRALGEPMPRQEALTIYSSGVASRSGNAGPGANAWLFRRMLLIGAFGLAIYVALRMLSPSIHITGPSAADRQGFAISQQVIEILIGAHFLSTWIWRECRLSQVYYLALAVVMLGLPALGASLGFILPALWDHGLIHVARYVLPALNNMRLGQLFCGLSFLLAGLLDHRQLVRALSPALGEDSL